MRWLGQAFGHFRQPRAGHRLRPAGAPWRLRYFVRTIPDGDETVQQCGERIFELILRVASGEKTASEKFDFGAAEFAPWVIGATT